MKTDWSQYTINYDGIEYKAHYNEDGSIFASEVFVPDSPTFRFPSEIINSVPSGDYKITSDDGIYEINLDKDLVALPSNKDRVAFDKISGNGWIERRTKETTLDGSEEWIKEGPEQQTENTTLFSIDLEANTDEVLCTHYKNIDVVEEPTEVTASGESLSINDTYNGSLISLEINGKSEQTQTTQSANLLDWKRWFPSELFISEDAETFTISMLNLRSSVLPNIKLAFKENVQYNIRMEAMITNSTTTTYRPYITYTDLTVQKSVPFSYNAYEVVDVVSYAGKTIDYINFGGTVDANATFTFKKASFQIQEGVSITDNIGFIPNMPSPYYLSDIKSVNNFKIVSSGGKNLLDHTLLMDKSKYTIKSWYNGSYYATAIPIPNGTYNVSVKWFSGLNNNECPVTLILSPNIDTTNSGYTGILVHGSSYTLNDDGTNFTVQVTEGNIYISASTTTTNEGLAEFFTLADIQIERGAVYTGYEPFNGVSIKGIDLIEPLRSLPSGVCDKLVIDKTTQTAWIERNVKYMRLNEVGLSASTITSPVYVNRFRWSRLTIGLATGWLTYDNFLCNNMKATPSGGYDKVDNYYTISGGMALDTLDLIVPKTFTTQAQVIAWLDANPTYIQFPIRTPYNEPIPYQEVLHYYPQTIMTTDSNLQPLLNIATNTISSVTNDIEGIQIKSDINKAYIRVKGKLELQEFKDQLNTESINRSIKIYSSQDITKTNLLSNKVSSSNNTELPLNFITNIPNPLYISKISSVDNFNLVSSGKNLFDESKWIIRDIESERNVLKFSGYYANGLGIKQGQPLLLSKELEKGATYTVTGKFKKTTYFNKLVIMYEDFSVTNIYVFPNNYVLGSCTFETSATKKSLYLYVDTGAAAAYGYAEQLSVQLEEGSTATPYKPYISNAINFPYTLRSLQNGVSDKLVIDKTAQSAWVERNMRKRVFTGNKWIEVTSTGEILTGNENWAITGGIPNYYRLTMPHSHSTPIFCSHFKQGLYTDYLSIVWTNASVIGIKYGDLNDNATEFKAFLAAEYAKGTPVTVVYQLPEMMIEPVPYQETLQYYPQTNITTDSILQPNLSASLKILT